MCLIAYVPDGRELEADVYAAAFKDNNDGIGIMSRLGVVRFLGKKMLKKARRYVRTQLAPAQIEYAIHFRFATHGDVTLDNTHPFVLPDGKSYLMHNGVISWCGYDRDRSDTGVFADLLDDYPGQVNDLYLKELTSIIGYGNKLCIMNADGTFSIVNADAGLWNNGIWYSNTYSLPDRLDPWRHRHSYTLGGYQTGRGNVVTFNQTQTWLDKFDAGAEQRSTTLGLDWESDLRLSSGRESNVHKGCGLPVPTGYRIKSQADYYASLDLDTDDYAELAFNEAMQSEDFSDDEIEQMELDNALLEMRKAGAA